MITDGMKAIDARLMNEAMEYSRRCGPRQSDPFSWSMTYHEQVAFEQARQQRSQHEWFAKASVELRGVLN